MTMKLWILDNANTRFCIDDMRANHGKWDGEVGMWTFTTPGDAANALAVLYRVTRATVTQRETLLEMIEDGTAQAAWDADEDALSGGDRIASIDREQASRLIEAGIAARRVLGRRILEEQRPQILGDHFDTSAFERGLEARRARVRRAAA
jgi:hypothetical protein